MLANGSGAQLDAADPLAGEAFLVVADLQGKAQSARIASAAAVSEDDIRAALGHRIETRTTSAFDPAKRSVRVRETARLGAIVLSERMLPAPSGAEADQAILAAIREHGLSLLNWSKEAETLRQRLSWLLSRPRRALAGRFRRSAHRLARRLAAALPAWRGILRPHRRRRHPRRADVARAA